jgi:hypothetical protein
MGMARDNWLCVSAAKQDQMRACLALSWTRSGPGTPLSAALAARMVRAGIQVAVRLLGNMMGFLVC